MAVPMHTSGAKPRNTQRQLTCSVRKPAITGPTNAGTTQAEEIAPNVAGRCSSG